MRPLSTLPLLFAAACAQAAPWSPSPALGALFEDAGVSGTLVVYDVGADRLYGHDEARARTRFVPASTFKIPHTLIGLATGAVADVDEVLPYGGQAQPFPQWEHDMGLREAIAISAVPIYQSLARRIGPERMREAVTRLGYGNRAVEGPIDRFWLDGPLAISAVEQAVFLAHLAEGRLPYPVALQRQVAEVILLERGGDWRLYGKTGWQGAPGPGVGWWVGWVERQGRVFAFALNIDMRGPDDGPRRLALGREGLRLLGVLP